EHIGRQRMLLAKLHAELLSPKPVPKQHFRERHFLAQLAGGVCLGASRKQRTPYTPLRPVPLPVPGRILALHHALHPAYSAAHFASFFAIQASQLPFARSRTRAM